MAGTPARSASLRLRRLCRVEEIHVDARQCVASRASSLHLHADEWRSRRILAESAHRADRDRVEAADLASQLDLGTRAASCKRGSPTKKARQVYDRHGEPPCARRSLSLIELQECIGKGLESRRGFGSDRGGENESTSHRSGSQRSRERLVGSRTTSSG